MANLQAVKSGEMVLRIIPRRGKIQEIQVETLNQVSQIWDRMRTAKHWRSSTAPDARILVDGIVRGYVSLNGRIWDGDPNGDRGALVFDPAVRS